jgi:hypothetical protein
MSYMGLVCPGADAPQHVKDTYRHKLTNALAEEVRKQAMLSLEHDDAYMARRHADWEARERTDGKNKAQLPERAVPSSDFLKDDCTVRTDAEVTRQVREKVFQTPEFEIEVPHLTVPVGALSSQAPAEARKIERDAMVKPSELPKDKRGTDTDFLLYQGDDE